MKFAVIAAAMFGSSFAFAHGSVPEQAASAIHEATEMLEHSQPRDVLGKFASVTATKTGHEEFSVVILMNDNSKFSYFCSEDESTEPVKWVCLAQ